MGGIDKGLVPFAGRPLAEWVIAALRPQVGTLLINANRNFDRYAAYGLPVIPDQGPGFQGPLQRHAGGTHRMDRYKRDARGTVGYRPERLPGATISTRRASARISNSRMKSPAMRSVRKPKIRH
jgi:hypothetical protein